MWQADAFLPVMEIPYWDMTSIKLSNLYNRISDTSEMAFIYWNDPRSPALGTNSLVFFTVSSQLIAKLSNWTMLELEQLKRLRSDDTPRRPMITHTIDSYWIPSQNKTNSKLQI